MPQDIQKNLWAAAEKLRANAKLDDIGKPKHWLRT
jgi:hypothetical protein